MTNSKSSQDKLELRALINKVAELVRLKPEKAVTLLTEWIKKPAKNKPNSKKRAA